MQMLLRKPQLVPVEKIGAIMDLLQSFQEEGLVNMLGIGGNLFFEILQKRKFRGGIQFPDACSLEGFTYDIPRYLEEGLAISAASSLHTGNGRTQKAHIVNAVRVKEIAQKI